MISINDRISEFKKIDIFSKIIYIVYISMAVITSSYHLWMGYAGAPEAWKYRATHLLFFLLLLFLMPNNKFLSEIKRVKYKVWDILLILLTIGVILYNQLDYLNIIYRAGAPNQYDVIVTFVLILLLFIATARTCGYPTVIIAFILLLYGFYGQILPGRWGHMPISLNMMVTQLYNTTYGFFSYPIAAASNFIVMFIILGAFLIYTKGADFFVNFAYALTGKQIGGPAKCAVVASALLGSIHGSGPGNVATTGAFTIPLMKEVGYSPEFAGAVEASASTGGILLPPVMGSAAFIMASITGIRYSEIIIRAAVPAILYFLSVFIMVHLEAQRLNLTAQSDKDWPSLLESLKKVSVLIVPIAILIYMLIKGQSPNKAGFYTIITLIITSSALKESRLNGRKIIMALVQGAVNMVPITVICGIAGIIVGMISITGFGVKLGALIITLSNGVLLIALLLTALACLILGLGMPGVAAYVIVASTVTPALAQSGVLLVGAHLFAYYYSQMGAITPPVALSSYAAAGIAGSDFWKTGWQGFRLASAGLLIPFAFVYNPGLMFLGRSTFENVIAIITACFGIFALASALVGYLGKGKLPLLLRAFLMMLSVILLFNELISNVVGMIIVGLIFYFYQIRPKKFEVKKKG